MADSKALATLEDGARLVENYAKRITSSERAQQFSTQISIMAQREPRIKAASPQSVVEAMMACVSVDLMPNTPEQLAYIIPYGERVQFQLGYKGLIALMYRSGQVQSVNAELVFEGDEFDVTLGSDRGLKHKPNFDVDRTDYKLVTHAYATVKLTNGEIIFDVMTRKELDKVKDFAKAKSTDAPWATWPEAMAKKTVVKRITKLLPASNTDDRLQYAVTIDSWAQAGRMKLDGDRIIEGEVIDESEDRRARMEAAVARRKELTKTNFTPKAVQNENE